MKKLNNVIIGIYKITNPKGKIYVGQSIDIERRKETYSKLKVKQQPKIYNSLKKYGWEQHKFEKIEECILEHLNKRETYWKNHYLNLFGGDWSKVLFCNLHDNGTGPLSEETKQKISKANKGRKYSPEVCDKISRKLKGRKHSQDTINKMRKPRSEEAKQNMRKPKPKGFGSKISKANKNNPQPPEFSEKLKKSNEKHYKKGSERNKKLSKSQSKPIIQYDLNNNFIQEWGSITEACLFINNHIKDSGIGQVCNGKRKTAYGYIWKFKM